MTDYCIHKMKTGNRKGRPCLAKANRTADGSYPGRRFGKAVFCDKHAPPMPPQMLDEMLWDLECRIRDATEALADVPDDTLRAARHPPFIHLRLDHLERQAKAG